MKPVDANPSMYIDFNNGNNKEGSKCKVCNQIRTPIYQISDLNG